MIWLAIFKNKAVKLLKSFLGFFNQSTGILSLVLIIMVAGLTCPQCNPSQFIRPKVAEQESDFEKNPYISAYLTCIRFAGEKGTTSGFNVAFCEGWLKMEEQDHELKICEKALITKKQCYNKIFKRDF